MKNIHVLPTDKPSRLHFDSKLFLSPNYQDSKTINSIVEGRNIYITNDEEIKYGNYVFNEVSAEVYRITILGDLVNYEKKIILTTDQDLIKEGVQAIDDDFLEWFVKNSSCEFVEVENVYKKFLEGDKRSVLDFRNKYKIIIPKEEPYSEIQQNFLKLNKIFVNSIDIKSLDNIMSEFDEPKQETLEEASNNYSSNELSKLGFRNGAKWQQERMYSEEDMKQFGLYLGNNLKKLKGKTIDEILEQFKKK